MKNQKLNQRQVLYLLKFNFEIKYVLKTSMKKTDILSKQLNQQKDIENNNK